MAVRLKDVAEAAGVSITLVSNYVNGKSARMCPATRSRIDQALQNLNYRPNQTARLLRTGGKSRTVGILTSGLRNEINARALLMLNQNLFERDRNTLIYYTKNEPGLLRTGYQELLRSGCAGVIVHGQRWWIEDFPLPQVLMTAERSCDTSLPEIYCDYRPGVEAVLEHLRSLGHKRILHFTLVKGLKRSLRLQVFTEKISGDDVIFLNSPEELTSAFLKSVLQKFPGATAAFCCNDLTALALREALTALGIRVPQDFSVAGFDNTETSELCGLTTVDQNISRRALSTVNALLNQLEKRSDPVEHYIPTELVIRNSCSNINI